jgi:hypothetical protein
VRLGKNMYKHVPLFILHMFYGKKNPKHGNSRKLENLCKILKLTKKKRLHYKKDENMEYEEKKELYKYNRNEKKEGKYGNGSK